HQQHQNAHVKEVRAEHHLLAPEELARLRAPAVLAGIETQDAADDQHGDGKVRIPAERQFIDEIGHPISPYLLLPGPTARFAARIFATTPVGPPISCALPAMKVTGASSHSSSMREGSSSGTFSCSS